MDECIKDITLSITRQLTSHTTNSDLSSVNFSGPQNISNSNAIASISNGVNNTSSNNNNNNAITPSTNDIVENKSLSHLVLTLNIK